MNEHSGLSAAILLSAALATQAQHAGARRRVYLFKPLTTSLTLWLAWQLASPGGACPLLGWCIVAGLAFALAGDIFLMLPSDRFLPGLVCFLVTHICYTAAFFTPPRGLSSLATLLPFAVFGAVMFRTLAPGAGALRVPVLVYAAAICAMAWQATERHWLAGSAGSGLALAGALLFVISDSVLGLNRFRRPFRWAQAVLLATYFAGQWLIALSLGAPGTAS
jgi:uncharacterized membrane protein YhhN